MTVAVIVVSFNTRDTLRTCLEHVAAECAATQAEVVVVDNASVDGSPEMVRSAFPWIKLIVNQRNRGFGAACNQGIAATDAPFILLVNSDCFIQQGAPQVLIDYLVDHPRVAAVGPRLLNEDGSLQRSARRFPTPARVLLNTLGLNGQQLDEAAYVRSGPMDYVSGACLLLRRTALDAVGAFDESYFFYAEEMDLAYRLWQRDWQVHYVPDARAVHLGGSSTRAARGEPIWLEPYFAGQARFFHKHYGTGALLAWQVVMLLAHGRGLAREARRSLSMIRLTLAATWRELARGARLAQ